MKVTNTKISAVKILEPTLFEDERGYFFQSFNKKEFDEILGFEVNFVQDNHSKSKKNVLRGLHYQMPPYSQGKLIRIIKGEVYDVAVDIRKSSPTFGFWVAEKLSSENRKQLWIPNGFAHGFLTLSETAEMIYKTTDYYMPQSERSIRWNDPDLNIKWLSKGKFILSKKDQNSPSFIKAELFE